MQQRFVYEVVEERGDVGLDDEEEELLGWDGHEGRAKDGVGRVGPDMVSDEIAVPGNGGHDGDGDEDGGLIPVPPGEKGIGYDGQDGREGYREFEMPGAEVSFKSSLVTRWEAGKAGEAGEAGTYTNA